MVLQIKNNTLQQKQKISFLIDTFTNKPYAFTKGN